ncbi:hypothetical protein B0J13DRAFT_636345 [Dactylonectria estremocensis]|uniref:Infection structure specific protein n=1 Tax=Dactylonectria estremocensis TaxID=1079267 RepID=A0A9P9J063_9HYPO|nr:hypothetical protein B0J13DRAFT_636345 [Dactylonectria estremocensis]
MRFNSQLMLAGAATAAAAAVINNVEKLHIHFNTVNYTPNKRDEGVLFARADRDECQSSVVDILSGAPTGDAELEDWAQSLVVESSSTNPCSLYVPSSLSEDMMEYMTSYIDWAADVQDEVADFNEECSQYVDGDVVQACPTPGTIFFTENNTTETVPLDTLVASATARTSGDDDNAAASRDRGLTAAIAAAVGVMWDTSKSAFKSLKRSSNTPLPPDQGRNRSRHPIDDLRPHGFLLTGLVKLK